MDILESLCRKRLSQRVRLLGSHAASARLLVIAHDVTMPTDFLVQLSETVSLSLPSKAIERCRAATLERPSACVLVDVPGNVSVRAISETLARDGLTVALFVDPDRPASELLSAVQAGHEIGLRVGPPFAADSVMDVDADSLSKAVSMLSDALGSPLAAVAATPGAVSGPAAEPALLSALGIEHAYDAREGYFGTAHDPLQIPYICLNRNSSWSQVLRVLERSLRARYRIVPGRGYNCRYNLERQGTE